MALLIAIVDDRAEDADRLKKMLTSNTDPGVDRLDVFSDAKSFLESFRADSYNIVFLDIQMDDMDGIELGKAIREIDTRLLIVYQSTSTEYVFDAFPIHSFDYIVKPYDKNKIDQILSEAKKYLEKKTPEITFKVAYGELNIPIDKIICAHSDKHSVFIKLTEGDPVRCIQSFTDVSEMLDSFPCFLGCNRGIYINMDHADFIDEQGIHMTDSEVYPIRTRDKTAITFEFSQYQIGRMKEH